MTTYYYDSQSTDLIGMDGECVCCSQDFDSETATPAYAEPDGFTCSACGDVFLPIDRSLIESSFEQREQPCSG